MHTGPIRSFSGLYCCTRLRSIDGSSETGRRVMNEVTIIIAQARKLFDLQVSGRHRRACAAAGTPQAWQEFMVKACSTLVRACSTRINLTAQETTLNPTASHTLYKHKKKSNEELWRLVYKCLVYKTQLTGKDGRGLHHAPNRDATAHRIFVKGCNMREAMPQDWEHGAQKKHACTLDREHTGRPADARAVAREGAEQRGWHSRMQPRCRHEAERCSQRRSDGHGDDSRLHELATWVINKHLVNTQNRIFSRYKLCCALY